MSTVQTRRPMMMRLGLLAALAVVAVLVVIVVTTPHKANTAGGGEGGTPAVLSQFKGIPQSGITLGSPKAPVTIVEFADLQCPFCAEYEAGVLPTLIDRYVRTGKVRLQLRLLRFLGPDSDRLARVAAAASTQNRMWQFAALAYARQGAENSALKNIAPFSRTPLRTSENASIRWPWTLEQGSRRPCNTFYRRRTPGQERRRRGHGQSPDGPARWRS